METRKDSTSDEQIPARSDVRSFLRNANRTDTGNAERLVACFGHLLRYDTARKGWLVWDGRRWNPDKKKWPMQLAKQMVRRFQRAVLDEPDSERKEELMTFALKCEQLAKLTAMLELAQSEPDIPISPEELDTDPWLLNVQNGTMDLRDGTFREHRQADLLTKLAPGQLPDRASPRGLPGHHLCRLQCGGLARLYPLRTQQCLSISLGQAGSRRGRSRHHQHLLFLGRGQSRWGLL